MTGVQFGEINKRLRLQKTAKGSHFGNQRSSDILYNSSMFPKRRTINAMISAVDETVANVTAALDELGIADDTLTILVSDNGGPVMEASGGSGAGNNYRRSGN